MVLVDLRFTAGGNSRVSFQLTRNPSNSSSVSRFEFLQRILAVVKIIGLANRLKGYLKYTRYSQHCPKFYFICSVQFILFAAVSKLLIPEKKHISFYTEHCDRLFTLGIETQFKLTTLNVMGASCDVAMNI